MKVINRGLVRKAEAIDRFHREVKAAAQLSHPNIVTAYDADQADDFHFMVMEYVDGVDLSQTVNDRGALPVAEACNYIRQAAIGLQHAHERGMVHRDIKPHNLMITKDGTGKILDFGLASLAPEAVSDDDAVEARGDLTAAGAIMGTPDFISPEQVEDARQADIRSDIYSLGTTLYSLLTGRPPFADGSIMHKLRSHAEAEPASLESLRDDIPADLAAVVSRMTAKNPENRYQTPAAVVEALSPFRELTASPIAPPAVDSSGNRNRRIVLSSIALFFFVLLCAVVLYIKTNHGYVLLEVTDSRLKVEIQGETITVNGEQPVTIRPGEHKLSISIPGSEFAFDSKEFTISRGDDVKLRVALLDDKIDVSKDGMVFDSRRIPVPREVTYGDVQNYFARQNQMVAARRLLREAAAISNETWEQLQDFRDPAIAAQDQSLTAVLLSLNPEDAEKLNPETRDEFRYIRQKLPEKTMVAEILSKGDGRSDDGYISIVPYDSFRLQFTRFERDDISKSINGSFNFRWINFCEGRADFVISLKNHQMEVVEFSLPNYGITIVRDEQGAWQRQASDHDKILGTWQAVYSADSGRVAPPEMVKNLRFIFTKDSLTMDAGVKTAEGTYRLEPSTTPKSIDLTAEGKTILAIYELRGDTLQICLSEFQMGQRPTAFESKPDSVNDVLMMFRRVDPAAEDREHQRDKIKGMWRVVSYEDDGRSLEHWKNRKLKIDLGVTQAIFTWYVGEKGDQELIAIHRLDPGGNAGWIDEDDENGNKGVYELDGDTLIYLQDLETGKQTEIGSNAGPMTRMVFSGDGKRLATMSIYGFERLAAEMLLKKKWVSGEVAVFDVTKQTDLLHMAYQLPGPPPSKNPEDFMPYLPTHIALDQDGSTLLVAAPSGVIKVIDVKTGDISISIDFDASIKAFE